MGDLRAPFQGSGQHIGWHGLQRRLLATRNDGGQQQIHAGAGEHDHRGSGRLFENLE